MAANHATVSQSLPSFAQAFSNHSLASISSTNNALPPILAPLRRTDPDAPDQLSRKRSRNDVTDEEVQIKQEHRDPSPPPPPAIDTNTSAPPPSATHPSPNKRRRVTVSGAPHPLINTDVPTPPDHTNSTPISPVVMGLTITRDNPTAIEKVKSMISVKQKQKALIEQRRGSVAISSPTITSTDPPPRALQRRSPNNPSTTRRAPQSSHNPSPRPPSPPNQTHSLPPHPISFASRRAEQLGSTKKKPADILISPREAQTQDQFQPAIQSAPPVPLGRFPMAIPRLPSVLGGPDTNVRRIATAVPPTPTRLSMQRTASSSVQPTSTSQRSPPAASVPIASTLVPPTPGLFHHPGYAGDKAAFLAPFELFYDALNDSKHLKTWLGEQLQRSNAIMQALTQQQEKLNEVVESLVEKQVTPMRQEMLGLQKRVEELEDALRSATGPGRHSIDLTPSAKHKGNKTPLRNGITSSPMPTESYTFPPTSTTTTTLEPSLSSRRRTELPRQPSPSWGPDRDTPMIIADAETTDSPVPFERPGRIEASRSLPLEPPPLPLPQRLSPRAPLEHAVATTSPKMKVHGAGEKPSLSRKASGHGLVERERERERESGQSGQSPSMQVRRAESRRNSVIMSPPDAPGSDG